MPSKINIEGNTYGELTVVKFHENRRNSAGVSVRYWECLCSCGNTIYTPTASLRSGKTKSCGCTTKAIKHNMHNTRIYQIWADMKVRCDCESNSAYKWYGARGIKYQESWSQFENFYSDMKDGYDDNLTLDRIDHSSGYSKENCRWISIAAQQRNKGINSRNSTGVTGVHIWIDKKNGGKYYVASCISHISKKIINKFFGVNKYGDEFAFFLACEMRDLYIRKLNLQGAGYTDTHGVNNHHESKS